MMHTPCAGFSRTGARYPVTGIRTIFILHPVFVYLASCILHVTSYTPRPVVDPGRRFPMAWVKLGVNVDHVATLRQARRERDPDPVLAALIAEQAGADGITAHLRLDRRHIQERDLEILRQTVKTRLNLEMAPTQEMVQIALRVKPDQCTLVPERPEEVTTEGGLDVVFHQDVVRRVVQRLQDAGIEVSLFIDPQLEQVRAAQRVGANAIEINTNAYAHAASPDIRAQELDNVRQTAQLAARLGLRVLAGHALNYHNVRPIVEIPEIEELNIGHAIIARALFVGFFEAVREMKRLLERG
jgi:pyridoxine 5-phosphate synthase